MSEYEIFNDEEEVVPEQLEPRKEKRNKEGKSCQFCQFFKEAFSLANLPLSLSIIAIFFSLFVGFLPLVSGTEGTYITVAIFFFIAFSCSFAGLVIESVKMVREKKFVFSVQLFVVIVALMIICLVGPLTLNLSGLTFGA